ncbi:MAG: chloramphenicol acetyltransferase [Pseudomonadota bacterium]
MPKLSPVEPLIHKNCVLTRAKLGRFVEVGEGSKLLDTTLGDYSYCERYCDIANADVGRFANIAAFVRIGATDHPMQKASQHHFLYRSASYWEGELDDLEWFVLRRSRITSLGHDTWIGGGAYVMPEVAVGHGAVVAACAVVTRDVGPYEIVAGVPAKPIKRRFPIDIAERLTELGWWDWSHEQLKTALPDFRDLTIEAFLEKYESSA